MSQLDRHRPAARRGRAAPRAGGRSRISTASRPPVPWWSTSGRWSSAAATVSCRSAVVAASQRARAGGSIPRVATPAAPKPVRAAEWSWSATRATPRHAWTRRPPRSELGLRRRDRTSARDRRPSIARSRVTPAATAHGRELADDPPACTATCTPIEGRLTGQNAHSMSLMQSGALTRVRLRTRRLPAGASSAHSSRLWRTRSPCCSRPRRRTSTRRRPGPAGSSRRAVRRRSGRPLHRLVRGLRTQFGPARAGSCTPRALRTPSSPGCARHHPRAKPPRAGLEVPAVRASARLRGRFSGAFNLRPVQSVRVFLGNRLALTCGSCGRRCPRRPP